MKFNLRIEDLELRSCSHTLMQDKEHTTAEIVKWETAEYDKKEFCLTVCYWFEPVENENYDLLFIGDRFLKENKDNLWSLIIHGQQILDSQI